jgi:hypothetical protein
MHFIWLAIFLSMESCMLAKIVAKIIFFINYSVTLAFCYDIMLRNYHPFWIIRCSTFVFNRCCTFFLNLFIHFSPYVVRINKIFKRSYIIRNRQNSTEEHLPTRDIFLAQLCSAPKVLEGDERDSARHWFVLQSCRSRTKVAAHRPQISGSLGQQSHGVASRRPDRRSATPRRRGVQCRFLQQTLKVTLLVVVADGGAFTLRPLLRVVVNSSNYLSRFQIVECRRASNGVRLFGVAELAAYGASSSERRSELCNWA